jgi:hypothetical protein
VVQAFEFNVESPHIGNEEVSEDAVYLVDRNLLVTRLKKGSCILNYLRLLIYIVSL